MLYPLIDITMAYLNKNDGMLTMHLFFCMVICYVLTIFEIVVGQIRIKRINLLFVAFFITIYVHEIILRDDKEGIAFFLKVVFACFLFWSYKKNNFYEEFAQYFQKYSIWWILVNIGVFGILALSTLQGGTFSHWDTITLKGPYMLNHTLAYIVLFMFLGNLYFVLVKKNIVYVILSIICFALMLLTGVRTVFIPILFLIWIYVKKKGVKGLIITILVGGLILSELYFTGIMDSIIEKTLYAAQNGSVSNGRLLIWKTSMNAYFAGGKIDKFLFGIGEAALEEYNLQKIGFQIQAHNDFITVFVSYGPFVFWAYLQSLVRNFDGIDEILLLIPLIFFNGFITYGQAIILFPLGIILVEKGFDNVARKKT